MLFKDLGDVMICFVFCLERNFVWRCFGFSCAFRAVQRIVFQSLIVLFPNSVLVSAIIFDLLSLSFNLFYFLEILVCIFDDFVEEAFIIKNVLRLSKYF